VATSVPPLKFDIDLSQDDMALGPNRDIAIVAGGAMVGQRVSLRLKAATGTYLGDPSYGAGLSSLIGNPLTPVEQEDVITVISDQALLEPLVNAVANIDVEIAPNNLDVLVGGLLGVTSTNAFAPFVATITA